MPKKITLFILNGLLFWVFAATLSGFLSKYCFLTDICSHFRLQYLMFGILALIIYLLLQEKRKQIFIILFLVILINSAEIIWCSDILKKDTNRNMQNSTTDSVIKIATVNILTTNTKYKELCDEILESNSDIIVLEEIDERWEKELQKVKELYPYRYEYLRDDNFGMAIYSKIKIEKFDVIQAGTITELPVISALVEKDGKKLEIIGMHTTPPTKVSYFENTCKLFEDIAEYINRSDIPVILTGDMNSSRFSYNYKKFIKNTKMKDAGKITQLTWPTYWLMPMRIQLDHIFLSSEISIKSCTKGHYTGSDHFPVYAEIYF